MNTVPWRSYGDGAPAPDQPMYVPVPGTLGTCWIVNDQHAAHMASIIEIRDQEEATAHKVREENSRINHEQEVKELCGYSEDDSDPEP